MLDSRDEMEFDLYISSFASALYVGVMRRVPKKTEAETSKKNNDNDPLSSQ